MKALESIPAIYKIAVIVLLLSYAVVINIEQMRGSQRYVVKAGEGRVVNCLTMMEGINEEIRYQQTPDKQEVSREKMHIFSKWLNCGVL